MFNQILFARIGWGVDYQGGDLVGRFRDDAWWEQYNFLRGPGDRCYGYIPPVGKLQRPPQPKTPNDWLVVFVSHENGTGAAMPVGFYVGANFESDYTPRPDGLTDQFSAACGFCVSTEAAYLIPTKKRSEFALPVEVTRMFTRSYAYARGNGLNENEPWRLLLAEIAERVAAAKRRFKKIG